MTVNSGTYPRNTSESKFTLGAGVVQLAPLQETGKAV